MSDKHRESCGVRESTYYQLLRAQTSFSYPTEQKIQKLGVFEFRIDILIPSSVASE